MGRKEFYEKLEEIRLISKKVENNLNKRLKSDERQHLNKLQNEINHYKLLQQS